MSFGEIDITQMRATGRNDAYFNLAYGRYRQALERLLATHSHAELAAMAETLPHYTSAMRLHAGSRDRPFDNWTDDELGLYLLVCYADGRVDKAMQEALAQSMRLAATAELLRRVNRS